MTEPKRDASPDDPLITDVPDPADVEAVGRGLAAFNRGHAPDDGHQRLAIFLRDPDGTVAAGLVGETLWGWLHVELLWVREDLRRRGHGNRLLAAAEAEAVRRGYRPFGQLPDFPPGHTRSFLTKRLPTVRGDGPKDQPLPSSLGSGGPRRDAS